MGERVVYQDIKVVDGDEYDAFETALFPETTEADRLRGQLYGRRDEGAAIDYLAHWDYGDPADSHDEPPSGPRTFQRGSYVLAYDTGLRHACLARRIQSND